MKRFLLVFVLAAFGCLASVAQNPYQLLWEIKKPGHAQASFLFGTMHISEAKVYDLPDSVILALQSCNYVALEADLGSACFSFFDYFFGEGEHTISEMEHLDEKMRSAGSTQTNLVDLFSDEEKLKRALKNLKEQEKTENLPAEDANELQFLDAFLFRLAREYKKEVVGLEQMTDQIDMLFGESSGMWAKMAEEGNATAGQLKEIYFRGDLSEIERLLENGDMFSEETRKVVLDKRNLVMARRSDSLMQLAPTFIGVGAAHLPGKYGVIALLRQRGYEVRPVDASINTGMALRAKKQDYQPQWTNWKNEAEGYSIDIPTAPYQLDFSDVEFPMYAGIDFAGGWMYYFMGVPLADGVTAYDKATFVEKFFEGAGQSPLTAPEKTIVGGLETYRGVVSQGQNQLRVQITFAKSVALVILAGIHKDVVMAPSITHLLESVKEIPIVPLAERGWQTFTDTRLGFEISAPANFKLKYTPDEAAPEDKNVGFWNGYMQDNDQEFLMWAFVLSPSYSYLGPEKAFNDFAASESLSQYNVESETPFEYQGYKGIKAILKGDFDKTLVLNVLLQANRMYIYGFSTKDDDPAKDILLSHLEQFKLLPLRHSKLASIYAGQGFEVKFPQSPKASSDVIRESWLSLPYDSVAQIEARDPLNSHKFIVCQAMFSPMTRVDSFAQIIDLIKPGTDEGKVLKSGKTQVAGKEAWSFVVEGHDGKTLLFERYFFSGSCLFGMQAQAVAGEEENVDEFFDSFKPDRWIPEFDWTASKMPLILEGLESEDEEKSDAARVELDYYRFTESDHELVLAKLIEGAPTPELPDHFLNLADAMVANRIERTPQDVRLVYQEFRKHPDFQCWLLASMLLEDTLGMVDLAIEFLASDPPQGALAYYRRDVGTSLSQAVGMANDPSAMLDKLAFLLKDLVWQSEFLYACQILGYLGELQVRHLGQYKAQFQEIAQDWVTTIRYDGELDGKLNTDYQLLLYALSTADPDALSFQLIRNMVDLGDVDLQEFAVLTLLEADLTVDKPLMKHMLDTPGHRFLITEWLLEHGQTKGLPKKYFKPKAIGRVDLEEWFITTQEAMPTRMELMGTRKIFFEGKFQKLQIYRVASEDGSSWYTAFAGPFHKGNDAQSRMPLTGSALEDWSPSDHAIEIQVRGWIKTAKDEQLGDVE